MGVASETASQSHSANEKPPQSEDSPLEKPTAHWTNPCRHEVGPRFELLKIARCHWLDIACKR